jgi:hypothetical protein
MLGHYVFFSLHDSAPAAVDTLIASAESLLTVQEGLVFFAIGPRTVDLTREVNDTQFDVALQIVFSDRASHDRYQESPEHLKFIEQNKENWSKIRVFDADLPDHHLPSSKS